jgi:hypothetical protein
MDVADIGPAEAARLEEINVSAREIGSILDEARFAEAERQIDALRDRVAGAEFTDPTKAAYARVLYHDCAGRHWGFRAVHAFTSEVDPIDSNTYSLRAIHHHERATEYARRIDFGDTDEHDRHEADLVAFHLTNVEDARGMWAMTEGEIQLRSGQFERAQVTLANAVADLRKAEASAAEASEQAGEPPAPGFSDAAEALLEEANSEVALISGDLEEAAAAEAARAKALEAATRKHAISEMSTSDYFARRMKHDAEFAHDRSRLFSDAARHEVGQPWFASYLFFVMAIGSAVALVWLLGSADLTSNPFVIALIFVFVFVVAGVSTKLGKWSDGAEILVRIAKSSTGGSGGDSEAP